MAKQVVNDFSKGSIISNILRLSIPMTLAQLINVLYSIVDRIYIGRMGENSSLALTGVGVCLPIITIVIAFANLIGMGGAPLFSIYPTLPIIGNFTVIASESYLFDGSFTQISTFPIAKGFL